MTVTILTAVCVISIAGLLLGALIAFTAKKFAVETDPRIEEVQNMLPGANCGGCGFAGCADMADAIVSKGASPALCTACSENDVKAISEFMGVTAEMQEKKVAVVPGTAFGESGEGFVRVSYAYSIENLQTALKRIGKFVEKYNK